MANTTVDVTEREESYKKKKHGIVIKWCHGNICVVKNIISDKYSSVSFEVAWFSVM